MDPGSITHFIKTASSDLGFDIAGITHAGPLVDDALRLKNWFISGYCGGMDYMKQNVSLRTDPRMHIRDAKSVLMLGINYFNNPGAEEDINNFISMYARGLDYHSVLRKKMNALLMKVEKEAGRRINAKFFVDASPILERALAVRSGIAWTGKNTCVINQRLGSWFFICGMISDLELEPDKPMEKPLCGQCTECIDACPTGAIVEPFVLDARRCISYLTIENRLEIPQHFRKMTGIKVFGCDICQNVCPWNRKAKETQVEEFRILEILKTLTLQKILTMPEEKFKDFFQGSPLKRAGWEGLLRNALVAAGNSGDRNLLPYVKNIAKSGSHILKEQAEWTEAKLLSNS